MIRDNGLALTEREKDAVWALEKRLGAAEVSLYRTSEGLRAFVVDGGGAEHLGVKVVA